MTTRVDVHGAFELDGAPERVFPLFTPRGERLWVDGWDPRFVHPPSGELELDQVFVTDVGGEHTVWSVVRHDPRDHAVEYLRVVPGSRVARVAVRVRAVGERSEVAVRYVVTALTDAAGPDVERFARDFDAMLETWRRRAGEALRTSTDA